MTELTLIGIALMAIGAIMTFFVKAYVRDGALKNEGREQDGETLTFKAILFKTLGLAITGAGALVFFY